mgnify:CR=1 FL=1
MITRDKNAFNVYNLGFTTQQTNDAVALFSNSHTTLNGTTVDNLETGTLTDANFEALMNSLREQKGQDGVVLGYEPVLLLTPTALHKEAQIITKSTLRSGTANNDLNYYSQIYPGLRVYFSPFLGANEGGSDTAYFVGGRSHGMYRWAREGVQTDLIDYKLQRNNNYIYKSFFREVVGPISYEGLVASDGSV